MIAIGRLRVLNLLNCAQNWHKSRKMSQKCLRRGKIATAAVSAVVRQLNFGIWRHRKIICAPPWALASGPSYNSSYRTTRTPS